MENEIIDLIEEIREADKKFNEAQTRKRKMQSDDEIEKHLADCDERLRLSANEMYLKVEKHLQKCEDYLRKSAHEIFESIDKIVAEQERFLEAAKKLKREPFKGYSCPLHRTAEDQFCNDIHKTETCVIRPREPKIVCPHHKTLEGNFCDDIIETSTCKIRPPPSWWN